MLNVIIFTNNKT